MSNRLVIYLLFAVIAFTGGRLFAQPQPIPVESVVHPDSLAALIPTDLVTLLPDSLHNQSPRYYSRLATEWPRGEEEIRTSASVWFRSVVPEGSNTPYVVRVESFAQQPESLVGQFGRGAGGLEELSIQGFQAFRVRWTGSQAVRVFVTDRRSATVNVPATDSTKLLQLVNALPLARLAELQPEPVAWMDPYDREVYMTWDEAVGAMEEHVVAVVVPSPQRIANIFPERVGAYYRQYARQDLDRRTRRESDGSDTVVVESEATVHFELARPSASSWRGVDNEREGPVPPRLRALAYDLGELDAERRWNEYRELGNPMKWGSLDGIYGDSTTSRFPCARPGWLLRVTPTRFLCVEPGQMDSTLAFNLVAAVDLQSFALMEADTLGFDTKYESWGRDGFILPDDSGRRRYRLESQLSRDAILTVNVPPGRFYSDPARTERGERYHLLVLADERLDPNVNVFDGYDGPFSAVLDLQFMEGLLWGYEYFPHQIEEEVIGWTIVGEPRVANAPLRSAAGYVPTIAFSMRKGDLRAEAFSIFVGDHGIMLVGVGHDEEEAERRLLELAGALTYDRVE